MTAVQTCIEPAPKSRNSTASCQAWMPPIPLIGTLISWIGGDRGHHVERDRLDGGPAIAAVAAEAADRRLGGERVQIHAHDRVDCIDQRERVGAACARPRGRSR